MTKVHRDTLLICESVLRRYIEVLAEHPNATTPEFKAAISDAYGDVVRARRDDFMEIDRQLLAVPTVTDQASLV